MKTDDKDFQWNCPELAGKTEFGEIIRKCAEITPFLDKLGLNTLLIHKKMYIDEEGNEQMVWEYEPCNSVE